ncbi:PIN domain-containing protein [Hymenobacter terricola]|uniref:PIN domain-containing protein n=1 Tax=Hymenobacter terricola TaxID=2819236 RepID=UPI001B30AF88|nr:PIN domain-containing protein [Hymenobacter terricola]
MMVTAAPLKIAEAVAACNAAPAPIVFIDTCALLDLIRYIGREPAQAKTSVLQTTAKGSQPATAQGIQTALRLLQASRQATGATHLIIHELVPVEWRDNVGKTKSIVDGEIQNANMLVARLNDIGKLNPAYESTSFHLSDGLSVIAQLEGLGEELQRGSKLVAGDRDCEYRAYQRSLRSEAPASKDKSELKDCTIIEHYLEVATHLSDACRPRYFVSSNKNDYGDNEMKLRAPLAAEFAEVGLKWIRDFSALHDLVQ